MTSAFQLDRMVVAQAFQASAFQRNVFHSPDLVAFQPNAFYRHSFVVFQLDAFQNNAFQRSYGEDIRLILILGSQVLTRSLLASRTTTRSLTATI